MQQLGAEARGNGGQMWEKQKFFIQEFLLYGLSLMRALCKMWRPERLKQHLSVHWTPLSPAIATFFFPLMGWRTRGPSPACSSCRRRGSVSLQSLSTCLVLLGSGGVRETPNWSTLFTRRSWRDQLVPGNFSHYPLAEANSEKEGGLVLTL